MSRQLHATAYWATSQGSPLAETSLPVPFLEPFEVRVRNHAIGINPVDWRIKDLGIFAKMFPQPWPKVLGVDSAGVVEEVGAEVRRVKVGDRVAAYTRTNKGALIGSFKDTTTVWADLIVKLPDTMSFASGSTFPLAYATATVGLNLDLGIPLPGDLQTLPLDEPILVLGGASAIGQMVLQLLKAAGFKSVIATAGRSNQELVRASGATVVLDRGGKDVEGEILRAAGGRVKYIYDAITSEETASLSGRVVDEAVGKIVQTGNIPIPGPIKPIPTFGGRIFDATAYTPYGGSKPHEFDFGKKTMRVLQQLIEAGAIQPVQVKVVQKGSVAESLDEALRLSKAGLGGTKAAVLLD